MFLSKLFNLFYSIIIYVFIFFKFYSVYFYKFPVIYCFIMIIKLAASYPFTKINIPKHSFCKKTERRYFKPFSPFFLCHYPDSYFPVYFSDLLYCLPIIFSLHIYNCLPLNSFQTLLMQFLNCSLKINFFNIFCIFLRVFPSICA